MKSLVNSIKESLELNEARTKAPKIGTVCYDYNGNEYEITDIFNPKKDKLDKFLNTYDQSGTMEDEIGYFRNDIMSGKVTIVGCTNDYGEDSCWVWGPEGVCYENK